MSTSTIFHGIVKEGAEWCFLSLVSRPWATEVVVRFPNENATVIYDDVTEIMVNVDNKTVAFTIHRLSGNPEAGERKEIRFHEAKVDPIALNLIQNGERLWR